MVKRISKCVPMAERVGAGQDNVGANNYSPLQVDTRGLPHPVSRP